MDKYTILIRINDNQIHCPICHASLGYDKCKVAIFKENKQRIVNYVPYTLLYCKDCHVHFTNTEIMNELLKTFAPLQILSKPIDESKSLKLKKGVSEKKYNQSLYHEPIIKWCAESSKNKTIISPVQNAKMTKHEIEVPHYNGLQILSPIEYTHKMMPICLCLGTLSCFKKGHKIESVTAIVSCDNFDTAKINIGYCNKCNKYFINKASLQKYRKIYGNLYININELRTSNGCSHYYDYGDYNEFSKLAACGYTVKKGGLSEIERQKLLVSIIESGQMEKQYIISHIEYLIRTRENVHLDACRKWRNDLDFLNEYRINVQREIFGCIINNAKRVKR